MTPQYLARLALARLLRPYNEEVIFHVFCEIERTPHLRRAYDRLLEGDNAYTKEGLNQEIGKSIARTLKATALKQINVEEVCEIVKWPSVLSDIDSDWKWEWEYS